MALKFVPPPNQALRFAVYRAPATTGVGLSSLLESLHDKGTFVQYATLGSAKSAYYRRFGGSRAAAEIKILELIDGDWYVLHTVPPRTTRKNLPWMKPSYYSYEGVKARPMTRDEYAAFRLSVERERIAEAAKQPGPPAYVPVNRYA